MQPDTKLQADKFIGKKKKKKKEKQNKNSK